jgi:hypothetical protein
MKRLIKPRVFKLVVVSLCALLATGCAMNKPHERKAQAKAEAAGLTALAQPSFDGTFVAPGTSLAPYKKLLVAQLDMDNVEILQPSSRTISEAPWKLNARDKQYYQERYTEALINNLVADGSYSTAMDSAADVLRIEARVLQIAPLASKDDSEGRPNIMKVYSEGFGTMTLEISLYDSLSGKVLAIITDKRDLGKIWEENNRAMNNQKVRLAFNAWLYKLRTELERLSK